MRLYEKYRPKSLAEVVGQDKAVALVRRLIEAGSFRGQAVWISGPSGAGKSTLARIIAESLAEGWMIQEGKPGAELGVSDLDDIRRSMRLYAPGKGGRVWIVNESHGLSARVLDGFLNLLEELPEHCTVIFTTTADGEDCFEDGRTHAKPFLSRCIRVRLTNQGTSRPFAERARMIAQECGLDGQPIEAYIKLAFEHKCNMRAMLQAIQSGAMIGGEA